ncbi:MAG: hypothetical protein WKF37_16755 [Bryobacteraceae bacterium]
MPPFSNSPELAGLAPIAGPVPAGWFSGNGTIITFRSTGRLRLQNGTMSDLTRSVSAVLKFHRKGHIPIETLRWYDN